MRDGTDLLYGRIDFENSTIELSETDGVSHDRRCITTLHEILHGIANHAELSLGEETDEEKIINILARGIYQVIQDNPELMDTEADGGEN